MKLNRAFGGVTFLVSTITGNYLYTQDLERIQRQATFTEDFMQYNFGARHNKEVGDDVAGLGFPDDGNGRYI